MADKLDLTVIIATRNEAANLVACLDSLAPAARVVVVDSHSTDGTADIASARGAEVVPFRWDGRYPRKRQWALDHLSIDTGWVALLDADESIPPALWDEIRAVLESPLALPAYLVKKQFHFMGRCLRFGGFSHSAVFLFRTGSARFENLLPDVGENLDMEVHERLIVDGAVGHLKHPLEHRDAKGLAAYVDRHNAYSTWEAEIRFRFLTTGRYGEESIRPDWRGNAQERRRFWKRLALRMPGEAWAWFLYHYLLRGAFLEGKRGLVASQIRRAYIEQVRAKVYEKIRAARRPIP
jgi:glycosyltransferase involved in cell wall biosynthesis